MTRYYSRETELASPVGRRLERQPITGNHFETHSGKCIVARFRSLGSLSGFNREHQRTGRLRESRPDAGLLQLLPNLSCGGWVGNSGARRDGGEIIPDHIRYDVSEDSGRGQRTSQLASAPAREPLTNTIHRRDVEA